MRKLLLREATNPNALPLKVDVKLVIEVARRAVHFRLFVNGAPNGTWPGYNVRNGNFRQHSRFESKKPVIDESARQVHFDLLAGKCRRDGGGSSTRVHHVLRSKVPVSDTFSASRDGV